MKIAILSMQKVLNYGSVLQAYSLKKIIEDESGTKVEFLDIEEEPSVKANMPIQDKDDYNIPYYCRHKFLDKVKKTIMYTLQKKCFNKEIRKFWENDLDIKDDITKREYDLVVVGSDEVFKCEKKVRLQLYGKIPNAKKIVTYAASCGSAMLEGIPTDSIDIVKECMSNYKKMSVRDLGTEKYVGGLYRGEIERNLDPVLVGPLASYKRKAVNLKKYIIIYAYNNRIRSKEEIIAIKEFARKNKLKLVCFGGVLQWCDLYIPADPFRLLDYFNSAEYIITDTFHGTIFSIINRKKFVTIIRKTNKNKLSDLLKTLKLEDRMLHNMNDLEDCIMKDIDYNAVDVIISAEREKTHKYIKECIELI